MPVPLTALLFGAGIFRFFGAGFFGRAKFFALFRFGTRRFTARFRAAFPDRLAARRLDSAQGAAEIFNFPLIAEFLLLGQFNQAQHFLHLLQRLFEGLDNMAHVVQSFHDGRNAPFDVVSLNRRLLDNGRFDGRRFRQGFGRR